MKRAIKYGIAVLAISAAAATTVYAQEGDPPQHPICDVNCSSFVCEMLQWMYNCNA
jgi:hypothetical protein